MIVQFGLGAPFWAHGIMVEHPDVHREDRGKMSGTLYILKSKKTGRYYIGSTNDLERRITEHNFGKTKSLRSHLPLELVFYKKFEKIIDARRMELKLKNFKSREIIDRIVAEKEIKTSLK